MSWSLPIWSCDDEQLPCSSKYTSSTHRKEAWIDPGLALRAKSYWRESSRCNRVRAEQTCPERLAQCVCMMHVRVRAGIHLFCVSCLFPCHCQTPLRNVRVPFCQSHSQSAKTHTNTQKVTPSFAQPLITRSVLWSPSCHCSSPGPSLTHLFVSLPPSLSPYLITLISLPPYRLTS